MTPVLFGTKCTWKKKRIQNKAKIVCNTKHAFALRLRVRMLIMILKCICSNVPKNPLMICPHPSHTPPLTTEPYCFHSAAGQRSVLWGKPGDRYLITVLVDQKIKIPAWYCLQDSYFSKVEEHRLFLTVESTRGIRTLVVVFELLEELVAWRCRNGKFNEQFQILLLELKVKFIWIAFVCISDGFRSSWLIYISYASCWQVSQNDR